MAETPNVWEAPPYGQNFGPEWEDFMDRFWKAVIGEPGYGRQWKLTQWNGPDYHIDVTSQDTVDGKAQRVLSQNATYGHRINNAEYGIVGAPTLDAFTTGSVLFVGASKVLSQDNSNLFWDDAANTLKSANLIVPTKAAIGAGSLGAEVLTVTGNGRVSTFLGVGGAPDTTHALLTTGLSKFTSRMGVGGDPDGTVMSKITGDQWITSKLGVGATVGTETLLVTGTQQVTQRFGVGAAPDGTAALKVTGASIFTGNITHDTDLLVTNVTTDRIGIKTTTPNVMFEVAGRIRTSASEAVPTDGAALELTYTGGAGYVVSRDYTGATYQPVNVFASSINLAPGATNKIVANTTGVGFFNVTPVAQASAPAAVTGTADATYSATEQGMLNDLVTAVNELITIVTDIGIAA